MVRVTLVALLVHLTGQIPDSQAASIYAAVLDALASPGDTVLLVDSSYISTLRPGGVAPMPRTLRTLRRVRFVTRAEVWDSLGWGRKSVGPATYWRRFKQRFGNMKGWYALSPLGLTHKGDSAVVFYEVHCGGLCGEGGQMTLIRPDTAWRVADRRRIWVN